ncbi:MAG TPA: hypothetical protein VFA21_08260 [Pyrinomonadaceae bacterium]|nr:hypothetical protein [Pyrinomonadaceae bacterium]
MKRKSCLLLVILLLTLAGFSQLSHQSVAAAASRGTIAYVRGGAEIRLVEPDGTNDRRVWTLPRPELAATMGVTGVAWRPDGQSVVFERARQFDDRHPDLWVMRLDGGDARLLVKDGSSPSWSR